MSSSSSSSLASECQACHVTVQHPARLDHGGLSVQSSFAGWLPQRGNTVWNASTAMARFYQLGDPFDAETQSDADADADAEPEVKQDEPNGGLAWKTLPACVVAPDDRLPLSSSGFTMNSSFVLQHGFLYSKLLAQAQKCRAQWKPNPALKDKVLPTWITTMLRQA